MSSKKIYAYISQERTCEKWYDAEPGCWFETPKMAFFDSFEEEYLIDCFTQSGLSKDNAKIIAECMTKNVEKKVLMELCWQLNRKNIMENIYENALHLKS